jgi:hypothetical protein
VSAPNLLNSHFDGFWSFLSLIFIKHAFLVYFPASSIMSQEIHFINLSHPAEPVSAESRRGAHAHAARTAHARRDRFRIMKYPVEAKDQKVKNRKGSTKKIHKPTKGTSVGSNLAQDASSLPILKTLLSSSRRDPFDSMAKSFTEFQYFLFDHC